MTDPTPAAVADDEPREVLPLAAPAPEPAPAGAAQLGVYAKLNRSRSPTALLRRLSLTGVATPRHAGAIFLMRF